MVEYNLSGLYTDIDIILKNMKKISEVKNGILYLIRIMIFHIMKKRLYQKKIYLKNNFNGGDESSKSAIFYTINKNVLKIIDNF